MPIQRLKTSKLFFNKWPYKVECHLPGAWAASTSRLSDKEFDNWLVAPEVKNLWSDNRTTLITYKKDVIELRNAVNIFRDDIKTRGEQAHLCIYCKDKAVFLNIEIALLKWIHKIWEPGTDQELEYISNNNTRKIVRDKLPYNICQYKLTLNDKVPFEIRNKFFEWSKKYPTQIIIAKSTSEWMDGARQWCFTPFMYISDNKMLTLVGLYLSGYIKHIEEFILRDSINTP